MATIIVGGGIIGLSAAYWLSVLDPELAADHNIHIIDSASHLLLSASGYAGGFLAKDWFSPAAASLGELSFRLHKELADTNDGAQNWGYAPSGTYSLAIGGRGVGSRRTRHSTWLKDDASRAGAVESGGSDQQPAGDGAQRQEMLNEDGTPAWFVPQRNDTLEPISSLSDCAQVQPKRLCGWLIHECEKRGVQIHTRCTATNIVKGPDGRVTGLKIRKDLEIYDKHASKIVFAAGAWTPAAFAQVFQESKCEIPVSQLAGYSIVVRSPRLTKPILNPAKEGEQYSTGISHGIFCPKIDGEKWGFAPEAFSRIGSHGRPEIYVAGLNDPTLKLPRTADETEALIDKDKSQKLCDAVLILTGLSKEVSEGNLGIEHMEIVHQGLCFRPVSETGVPIISRIPDTLLGHDIVMPESGGVYVATGHGPWGISLSLGTGRVMAEMLTGQTLSADISALAL